MASKRKKYFVGFGITIYVLGGIVACLFLASFIFYLANKMMPDKLNITSLFDLWNFYKDDSKQASKLYASIGLSVLIVFFVPFVVTMSSRNRPRALHGDSRFATTSEIAKSGLDSDNGIIVGKHEGRFLIQGGQTFVLLAAPTRSWKGVAMVIPNLLNWHGSCIVLDIKKENYKITSKFRQKHGQSVFLFDPFSEDGTTHCWNVFDTVRDNPMHIVDDVMGIGFALYPDTGDAKSDYWQGLARNLFLGVSLYLFETPDNYPTLAEVLRFGSGGGGENQKKYIGQMIEKWENTDTPLSPRCIDALNRFRSSATSENTAAGILSTFTEPLTVFSSPLVEAATSKSDFDLGMLRKKKITIYLGVLPERLSSARQLLNVFFTQAVNLNTRKLPEEDPTLKYPLLLLPDEFTAIGKIQILSKAVGYIAGYNIRLLPIIQAISQLEAVYREDTRTFVSNHETQVIYAPREQKDANEYSEMLGTFTQKAKSRNRSKQLGGLAMSNNSSTGSSGESESDQKRALMMPQEIKEMDESRCIVICRGKKPILCDKPVYYNDHIFINRLKSVSPSLKALGKKLPTEAQLKHIAFVKFELSSFVPKVKILINEKQNTIEKTKNTQTRLSEIKLEKLGGVLTLPPLDDQEKPSDESIDHLVDSFFDQLQWSAPESTNEENIDVDNVDIIEEFGINTIDLSVLEMT
ncbi:MAG: type IV secretory system conjugative DNA transfer family protein [Cellvibrionaceae bacterium]